MTQNPEFIPEQTAISDHYLKLWEEHDRHPVNSELWNEVTDLVMAEKGTPDERRGPYGEIAAESLLQLSKNVRLEADPIKRYGLVMQPSPTGEIWFDVLRGFKSPKIVDGLAETLSQRQWHSALDLGTGTGQLADRVRPLCDNLVGLDRVKPMLDINHSDSIVQADATQLSFKNNSFDLVISSGLSGSFTTEQAVAFFDEIARVLQTNGVYIDAFYLNDQHQIDSEFRQVLVNAKGILADMIVDQVSGKSMQPDADYDAIKAAWETSGLHASYFRDPNRDVGYRLLKKL